MCFKTLQNKFKIPFAAMAAAALSLGGVIVLNRKKK